MADNKFKIEVSDVRISPDELKRIEDHISDLENRIELTKETNNRISLFIKKLSEVAYFEDGLANVVFGPKDYDIRVSSNMASDRIHVQFRERN